MGRAVPSPEKARLPRFRLLKLLLLRQTSQHRIMPTLRQGGGPVKDARPTTLAPIGSSECKASEGLQDAAVDERVLDIAATRRYAPELHQIDELADEAFSREHRGRRRI